MQIPSSSATALLNTMRDQIAQLRPPNPQQVQQIEAQTGRKLQTLETDNPAAKGTQVDLSA